MSTDSKFVTLENQIFSVFATPEWVAEKISVHPASYINTSKDTSFCRLDIVSSGKGVNLKSVSGMLIIDIFTPFGVGPRAGSVIADKLDSYLVGKTIVGTQLMGSTCVPKGPDKANPSLLRSTYTIAFNHFGV